jgi:hypothetical protein
MKRIFLLSSWIGVGATLLVGAICSAQMPELPKPTMAHDLLKQFGGDWKVVAECMPEPGKDPVKCEGVESAKMLGGFFLVSETESDMMGMPVKNVLTIGYDPAKKKYVGTFVCSMDGTLWNYVGAFDETGKKLVLETEGPIPFTPGKRAKFRETLELKDKDHKEFTSQMQGDDGKWAEIVKMTYTRKK